MIYKLIKAICITITYLEFGIGTNFVGVNCFQGGILSFILKIPFVTSNLYS